jgi:hypothetical protein
MSGRIPKSQIPVKRLVDLAPPDKADIIRAKNSVRENAALRFFGNEQGSGPGDGPPLPGLSHGSRYVEFPVGQAHPGDARQAGRKRVVFELHIGTGKILETYFTPEHYAKFSFYRIV